MINFLLALPKCPFRTLCFQHIITEDGELRALRFKPNKWGTSGLVSVAPGNNDEEEFNADDGDDEDDGDDDEDDGDDESSNTRDHLKTHTYPDGRRIVHGGKFPCGFKTILSTK